MKRWSLALTSVVALAVGVGCTHSVHEVQVSDFTPYKRLESGEIVKGYGEQFVILWFTNDTDYVEKARANLIKACPNGSISGITTQLSTSHGFFSWTNKALMQGLCVKSVASNQSDAAPTSKKKSRRQPSSVN